MSIGKVGFSETARSTDKVLVRWSALLLLGGVIVLLLMEWMLFPLTVDDAYISFRYSDNLAHGHGLVWNVGDDPVEGYTNFLWVLLGAAVIKLGLPLPLTMKLLSVGLSIFALVLVYSVTRLLSPQASWMVMPTLLFACTPAFALWTVAGLETALFICLLLASLYTFLREESNAESRTTFWSALLLTLLALTRPEGAVVFGALFAARLILWLRHKTPRKQVTRYLAWVLFFGCLCLVYFVWRWTYFGYPLPNTAYVKAQPGVTAMLGQIGVNLIPYGLRLFPFAMLALYALGRSDKIRRGDIYIGAALAGLVLLSLVSSDWMAGHRLALPMIPLVLLLARQPLEIILQATRTGHWRQRFTHAALLLGLVLYAVAPLFYTANLFHRVLATQKNMSLYRWATEMQTIVDGQYVKVGQWLADNALPNATVVAGNVGAIGYLSDLKVIDMIGLTDEYIARNSWTVEYLLEQNPDFIILESDTRDEFGGLYGTGSELFAATPKFVEQYELLFVLDNGRIDEMALFIHHLPHATWLFARKDLNLTAQNP